MDPIEAAHTAGVVVLATQTGGRVQGKTALEIVEKLMVKNVAGLNRVEPDPGLLLPLLQADNATSSSFSISLTDMPSARSTSSWLAISASRSAGTVAARHSA